MTTYIIYNVETGELLKTSSEPLTVSGHPLQTKEIDIAYPVDLGKYEWVGNLVNFVPKSQRVLTKLQYMNLFADTELSGIYAAAKVNVAIEVLLEKFKLASEINLDDPQTIGGLYALESAGLLAVGRAAEILNG